MDEQQEQSNQAETLKELCQEAVANPGEFAVLAQRMPPQLAHRMHTILIATLLNMVALQSAEIQAIRDQLRDDSK